MTVAEARAELVEAIEELVREVETPTPAISKRDWGEDTRAAAWREVETKLDFFENTVDYESYEYGKQLGYTRGIKETGI